MTGGTAEAASGQRSEPSPAGPAAEAFIQFDVVEDVADHRFVSRTEPHQNPR